MFLRSLYILFISIYIHESRFYLNWNKVDFMCTNFSTFIVFVISAFTDVNNGRDRQFTLTLSNFCMYVLIKAAFEKLTDF